MADTLDEAIEYRLRMGEETQRQLDMLRVTLRERVAQAIAGWNDSHTGLMRHLYQGREDAYRDVLSLLGPEPAWYADRDGNEPF